MTIARAHLPTVFASADRITQAFEALSAYGQSIGLTKEEAEEVITVWSRETPMSIVADEKAFHGPLMYRALGSPWEPDRYINPAALARQVAPLVEALDDLNGR